MQYVRFNKSRGFKYACDSHLCSQYGKRQAAGWERNRWSALQSTRNSALDLQIPLLLPLMPISITWKIYYLQIHSLIITYYTEFKCVFIAESLLAAIGGLESEVPQWVCGPLEGYCYVIAWHVIIAREQHFSPPSPHCTFAFLVGFTRNSRSRTGTVGEAALPCPSFVETVMVVTTNIGIIAFVMKTKFSSVMLIRQLFYILRSCVCIWDFYCAIITIRPWPNDLSEFGNHLTRQ